MTRTIPKGSGWVRTVSRRVKGDLGTNLRKVENWRRLTIEEHSRVFCPVVNFPQKTNDVVP